MKSWELENLLRCITQPKCNFKVIARDEVDTVSFTDLPLALIINSTDRRDGGEHWIALWCSQKPVLHIEAFDPLGFPLSRYKIKIPHKVVVQNKVKFQGDKSSYCGHFCIYYLFFKLQCKPTSYITSQLTQNYKVNDEVVLSFVNCLRSSCLKKTNVQLPLLCCTCPCKMKF